MLLSGYDLYRLAVRLDLPPKVVAEGFCDRYTGPDTGFRGLVYRGEKAYIYDDNGQMQKSGWYEADGDWHYLNGYGAGAVSCWRDGTDGSPRYLKADGKMARNEWIEDYGNWYYLGLDGR